MVTTNGTRRRVLIGAYACGPLEEPEASAGWAVATAACATSDVWVVTRKRFAPAADEAIRQDPVLRARLHMVYSDLPARVLRLKRRPRDMYWYYVLWQWKLGRTASRLHAHHRFDVLHHVTFANDWLPCGLTRVPGVPLIWGPVGGASDIPYWRLRRWLGFRGFTTEVARGLLTTLPRRWWGERAARRASLIVAQNDDVARRFARFGPVEVHPNAALDDVDVHAADQRATRDPEGPRRAVFVGRLIGLKGVRLALDALAATKGDSWRLVIYGDGYDREVLEKRSARLGITDRVEFMGHRPRAEVLAAFQTADAMLFPSMHDQAGWAAAEASTYGCPVVCLPLGGPPLLAQPNAFVASLKGNIVENLVEQLELAGRSHGKRHNLWTKDRLTDVVDRWYTSVTEQTSG